MLIVTETVSSLPLLQLHDHSTAAVVQPAASLGNRIILS
jgi:hypothetical protein